MSPFYRCFGTDDHPHDEVRWSWVDGRHCWLPRCGALGKPCAAFTITSAEEFVRELDDILGPMPRMSSIIRTPPASPAT